MTSNFDEMLEILEQVTKINRRITRPFIRKKTGLKIVEKGEDHGMVVTEADLNVSKFLLNGGLDYRGFRKRYPGSFSEENDSANRIKALSILQLDPIDGTGDFVDTYKLKKVTPPTTLVSKLTRNSLQEPFKSVAGFIFDIENEFAILSDGNNIILYKIDENGKLREKKYEKTEPENIERATEIKINRRVSYPQLTFDGPFMRYLSNKGLNIKQIPVGGAGIFALQIFRNYITPFDHIKGFSDLEKLTIGFNTQPDWKTWDTDPIEVIANTLGLPRRTDIYGSGLTANAEAKTLREMYHTTGYVISTSRSLQDLVVTSALEFERRNSDCPLITKDYSYKEAIASLYK